jgi:hypothetical protein
MCVHVCVTTVHLPHEENEQRSVEKKKNDCDGIKLTQRVRQDECWLRDSPEHQQPRQHNFIFPAYYCSMSIKLQEFYNKFDLLPIQSNQ